MNSLKKIIPMLLVICFLPISSQAFDWKKLERDVKNFIKKETKNDSKTVGEKEAASGLKEALVKGSKVASTQLSKKDGFLKNQAIKILFPPEFQKAEKTLRKLGFGREVDKTIVSFNRAAEKAVKRSYPIFKQAILSMSFGDAMQILFGKQNAATTYLEKKTTKPLESAFLPIVRESADDTLATKYWNDLAKHYNRIPFISRQLPEDISKYITTKAVGGIFYRVEIEEKLIRKNPMARTTDILKRVFGYAESKKKTR